MLLLQPGRNFCRRVPAARPQSRLKLRLNLPPPNGLFMPGGVSRSISPASPPAFRLNPTFSKITSDSRARERLEFVQRLRASAIDLRFGRFAAGHAQRSEPAGEVEAGGLAGLMERDTRRHDRVRWVGE